MVATALQPHLPGRSSTSTTASTVNAAQASTLETLGTQSTAVESQRISDLQDKFQQQAQQDPAGFRSAMREAFGDKASLAQIDQLLDLALAGKLPMPSNIQFVGAGSLGSNALGAYDANNGGSLYLDRSLLSDPTKLESVFNEEMGHHLDALLGGADAVGDEGAVFSQMLEQGTLSQSELTVLKSENDHGYITVDGESVAVEFRNEDEGSGNGQSPSPSPVPSYSGPGSSPGTGGSPSPSPSPAPSYSGPGSSPGTGSGDPPGTGDPPGGDGPPGGDNSDDDIGAGPRGTGGGGPPGSGGSGPPGDGGGSQDSGRTVNDLRTVSGVTPDADTNYRTLDSVLNELNAPKATRNYSLFDFERHGEKHKEDGDRLVFYDVDLAGIGTESAADGRSGEANLFKLELGAGLGLIENTSTFRHGLFTAGLSGRVLTADAEALLGLNGNWDQLSIGGSAKGGYSVDLVSTKLDGEVFISGKNVWDNLADGYNVFVDPAIDSLFGRDVAELGYAPEWMDHGVYIGGHAEFGLGSAVKFGLNTELGLKSSKVGGSLKFGQGIVLGVGGNVGWK